MEFKKGDKFILEVEEVLTGSGETELYRIQGFNALVFDKIGLNKLERYEGVSSTKAYKRGLCDLWESLKTVGQMSIKERQQVFGKCISLLTKKLISVSDIINAVPPEKIVNNVKCFIQKNDVIKVGDEVRYKNDDKLKIVVTRIEDTEEGTALTEIALIDCSGRCEQGNCYATRDAKDWVKTGKHYD